MVAGFGHEARRFRSKRKQTDGMWNLPNYKTILAPFYLDLPYYIIRSKELKFLTFL
jgi:hypothetical protein